MFRRKDVFTTSVLAREAGRLMKAETKPTDPRGAIMGRHMPEPIRVEIPDTTKLLILRLPEETSPKDFSDISAAVNKALSPGDAMAVLMLGSEIEYEIVECECGCHHE